LLIYKRPALVYDCYIGENKKRLLLKKHPNLETMLSYFDAFTQFCKNSDIKYIIV